MLRILILLSVSVFLLALCFWVLVKAKHIWFINQSRRKGFYPSKGKATMFHVRDLLLRGEKELAIQMYCEIFQVGRKEAVAAIEELERSIQQKNIESD
ncbi:MAG TPA: hypothetical protein VI749_00195 [Candidatus Omnitrophota bacterium]|nr:hypothetical protein [Candidatus Omnitrophota bacterium]